MQDKCLINLSSKTNQRIKLLAFDAYGTLCYIANKRQAYQEIIHQPGMGYKKTASLLMTSKQSITDLFDINSIVEQVVVKKIQEEVNSVIPFDESLEVLRRVREQGMDIAIVSNLSVPYAEPLKNLFGKYVDYYIFSFDVGYKKPGPEIYAALLEKTSCQTSEVLMVGDNIKSDVEGAKNVGIKAVWLNRNGVNAANSISTLDEIFECL